VFIVALSPAGVQVKDRTGQQWCVERFQVDCGVYYQIPSGGWVHESTAKGQRAARHCLRNHLASPRPEGAGEAWDEKASQLLWIIQRNARHHAATDPTEETARERN
jgi:hypothetical protein